MSSHNTISSRIKAFGMSHSMLNEDLIQIEDKYGIELGIPKQKKEDVKEIYYPQFGSQIRKDAKLMSEHYELFYCLEKSIRELVTQSLEAAENSQEWWSSQRIPANIKSEVEGRIQKEVDSGVSKRSEEELDYTTFGELSQIITSNWDVFGGILTSKKAVEKVMASLNTLRGPIAHCSIIAEDEIVRLHLTIRDWFRLME